MNPIQSPAPLSMTIDLNAPGRHVGDIMLRWSDNSIPLGYHPVPVISIKGGDGPVVLILGGTHGDEFEGPAAIMRLADQLSPDILSGHVVLMPALNTPAVADSARVSPLDGANLNRAFPGDAKGGPTAMLADYVENHLIPRCDAVIDLHSGGKASFFTPCALATRTEDEALYQKNMEMAHAFGLSLIWQLGAHNDQRSVNSAAERAQVPMIAAELGGGGGVDPAITNSTEAGLLNCLRHLGVLDGDVIKNEARIVEIASPHDSLYAPADGLYDRQAEAGQNITKGDSAGRFHHPLDPARPSTALSFPSDGMVLAHTCRGLVKRGDLLTLFVRAVKDC